MNQAKYIRETLLAAAQTGVLVNACPVSTDADDTLRHVATCVDRTTLARRILISLSNETNLSLDVQNRRLLQFSITSRLLPDRSNDLDQRDTICVPKKSAEIAQQLKCLLKDSAIVRQRIIDDPTIIFPTTSGLSAASLLQCIDDRPQPNTPIDLVAFLTQRIEDAPVQVLGACVLTAEDILAICGSDEQLLDMVDLAKPILETPDTNAFPMSNELQSNAACVVDWHHPTSRRLLILNTPEQVILVLVEIDQNVGFLNDLRTDLNFNKFFSHDIGMADGA